MSTYFFNSKEELINFIFNEYKDIREFYSIGLETNVQYLMDYNKKFYPRYNKQDIAEATVKAMTEINAFCDKYFFPCVIETEIAYYQHSYTEFTATVKTKKEYYTNLIEEKKNRIAELNAEIAEYEKIMNET